MIQSEVRIFVVNDERNIGNNLSMVLDLATYQVDTSAVVTR
jgi:DNA-binding NtrC family response regulator